MTQEGIGYGLFVYALPMLVLLWLNFNICKLIRTKQVGEPFLILPLLRERERLLGSVMHQKNNFIPCGTLTKLHTYQVLQ